MSKSKDSNLFTTKQAVRCLKAKIKKNIEFKNATNERIEIFMCTDGKVGIAEIGCGFRGAFNKKAHKDDLWILCFNPYRK